MALVSKNTNLKNLKYGNDRFGGGSSNQPYIKNSIPVVKGVLGDDFLLRGGVNAVVKSGEDVVRLTKYFFDLKTPKGLLFTTKQNLLSRVAVRTQASGILNEKIYTPLSSLAQAGIVAFGGHLNKQGINPFEGVGQTYTPNMYYDKTNPFRNANDSLNISSLDDITIKDRLKNLFEKKYNSNDNFIFKYRGGPSSVLGIGSTTIKFASERTNKKTIDDKSKESLPILVKQNNAYYSLENYYSYVKTHTDITGVSQNFLISNSASLALNENSTIINSFGTSSQQKFYSDPNYTKNAPGYNDYQKTPTTPLEDFRKLLNYPKLRIEDRVKLGDPGLSSNDKKNNKYSSSTTPLDTINALPLYQQSGVRNDSSTNDLVKFRIASIDLNSDKETFIHFRAFLNSISDNYSADWEAQKYLGRAENFYNQTGFNRTVSLSWTVVAQSKPELIEMYKKLNYLASTLAPDYRYNGFLKGSLVKLTIGGYFYEQPGFITSLTYDIGEDTPWEIGINDSFNGGEDTSVKELPHIIRVSSFNFTPIHTFAPSKQYNSYGNRGNITEYGNQKYIALKADNSTDNY